MPATVEPKKGNKLTQSQIILSLEELKSKIAECQEEMEMIAQVAEEEGRELTEDEYEQIDGLAEKAEQLRDEYVTRSKEDRHAVTKALIHASRERNDDLPDPGTVFQGYAGRRVTHLRPRFLDDPKRQFADLGEFAATIYQAAITNGFTDERLARLRMEAAATGMSQGVGADGGFLVPPEFRTSIWMGLQQEVDNIFAMTDQYPVTGESLTFPAVAETSRANGSRWGGVRAYWLAEAAQITSSNPSVRQMKLEPQELAALVYVTDKLLRNAPALNTFLTRAATEEILFTINNAIINGDGVGKPTGVLNSPALVTVSAEAGQAAATVVLENINNMWSRMHARTRSGAMWFINQDVEPALESLSATAGTGGFPVYLPQGAGGPMIQEASTPRLKGRPVMSVEYCATLGTVGDIILMNPMYYATGVQGALRDDMSMHLRFDYAETAFRFMFAVDGKTWLDSALTPFSGSSNTLSAYVALATRS